MTDEVSHRVLGNVKTGDTLRVVLDDELVIANVDETRQHEEGEIVGQGLTIIEDGKYGDIYDLETPPPISASHSTQLVERMRSSFGTWTARRRRRG